MAMARAMDIASIEGLDGLTIGRLAADIGASKSGVASLFGSKEQLQLAAVASARGVFTETVVDRARSAPRGLQRVCAIVRFWLEYSERRVFAGGCFFQAASVEFDAKPGPVRDAVAAALGDWDAYLTSAIQAAMDLGQLPGLADASQLAFELNALLSQSNTRSLLTDSADPYAMARAAVHARLECLGADVALLADAGIAG